MLRLLLFVVDSVGVQRCTAVIQADAILRRDIAALCKSLVFFDAYLYLLQQR